MESYTSEDSIFLKGLATGSWARLQQVYRQHKLHLVFGWGGGETAGVGGWTWEEWEVSVIRIPLHEIPK